MSATLIDGKAIAAATRAEVAREVAELKKARGVTPGLAVILVGADPASEVYVKAKEKAVAEAGMNSYAHHLPATTTQVQLEALIQSLNMNPIVHGILLQLPLPQGLEAQPLLEMIAPEKDVDGFHPLNAGKLVVGQDAMAPCTPMGCMILLRHVIPDLKGLHAVVVGRSNIVGRPVAEMLLHADCTVSVAARFTKDLGAITRQGDILVVAVGKPGLITGDMIKPGAVVIDVGINRTTDANGKSKLVGDVDFEGASRIASAITPVPGGVGPMTIACLLQNTLKSARKSAGV